MDSCLVFVASSRNPSSLDMVYIWYVFCLRGEASGGLLTGCGPIEEEKSFRI